MSRVLAVFAHADDEVLACGGTLARHAKDGDDVRVLAPFTDGVGSREGARADEHGVPLADKRRREWYRALAALGAQPLISPGPLYPDQMLDVVPLLAIAKRIEAALDSYLPDIVYTHSHPDLNQDHSRVAEATMIATRPAGCPVKQVYACEIPESTAARFGFGGFWPNVFVKIDIGPKIRGLRCYESERRLAPHPRSEQQVATHCAARGAIISEDWAEAFMLMRSVQR